MFRGTIPIDVGGNRPGGLWALACGNGVTGRADTLYFNDGINGERDGLFGAIAAVPEPGVLSLMAVALAAVAAIRRRG